MAKNDKDRLIGRSKSQTLLRRSGLFRKTGGYSAAPAVIQCLYPLDDDGTVAASLGYSFASEPTIDGGQTVVHTYGGTGAIYLWAPAGAYTTARFSRKETAVGFEVGITDKTITYAYPHPVLIITDAAGTLVNVATFNLADEIGGTTPVEVAADGTVSSSVSPVYWRNTSGQKFVGATDMFALAFDVNENGASGGTVTVQLRTCAASLTGTYSTGCTDIAGTVI